MKGMSSDSPISSNILLISRKISKILANFVKYLKTSKDDKATHLNSETNQNANQPKSIDSQEKTSANQHNSVNYSYENSSTVSIHLSEANKPSASTSSSSTLVLPTRIQTIQTPKESLKRRLFKSPPNSNSRQKCKQSFKQTTTLKEIESKPNIEASLSGIDDDDDDHKSEWNSMSTENNIKKSQENEYEQMGQLQPWPISTNLNFLQRKNQFYDINDEDIPVSSNLIIKIHAEYLLNALKQSNVQLSRRDLEIQRLAAINKRLGEQYTRLRTQYVELSNEQARLRQRYDMMTLQIMNMERLQTVNKQLETELQETRQKLLSTQERDNQIIRHIGRMEAEVKDNTLDKHNTDAIIANLKAELNRKQAKIDALTLKQHKDAAREIQARFILNELIELKGNLRVFVRCINLSNEESAFTSFNGDTLIVKPIPNLYPLQEYSKRPHVNAYKVHRLFPPNTPQKSIYTEVRQLVTSCIDGYTVAIVTYGQAGTGKTYTILGAQSQPGIIPKAARQLFTECKQRQPAWTYQLSMVVIQIYKENIFDLLAEPKQPTKPNHFEKIKLNDNGEQIILRGAIEEEVNSEEEILKVIHKARIRRYASSKILGAALSNLHFIVIIRVRGACLLAHHGNELHQLGENKACNDETLIDPELKYAENFGNMNANTPKGSPEYRPNTALPFKVMQVNTTQNKSLRTATHGLLIFGDLAGFDPGEDIYQQNYRKQQKDQQQSQHHHVGELSAENPENISNLPGKHTENQSSSNDTCVEEAKRKTSKKETSRPIGKHNNTHNVIYEADRHMDISLLTFNRVIQSLAESESMKRPMHIPFRDSKLTHLLKPAMSNDAKFLLIITLNIQKSCLNTSLKSLQLAKMASTICFGKAKQNIADKKGIHTSYRYGSHVN